MERLLCLERTRSASRERMRTGRSPKAASKISESIARAAWGPARAATRALLRVVDRPDKRGGSAEDPRLSRVSVPEPWSTTRSGSLPWS